jgi:hypothetical protein
MAGNNNFRSIALDGLEAAKLVYAPALDLKASARLTTLRWPAYHGTET